MNTKVCIKCMESKSLDSFSIDKKMKDGKRSKCKDCLNFEGKTYRKNPDVKNRQRNKLLKWRKDNPYKDLEYQKKYYQKDPEKFKERARQYRLNNPEYKQQWIEKNPNYYKERLKNKRLEDPQWRLGKNISTGIYLSLKGNKKGHWELLVGYTLSDLKHRLESLFKSGMSWSNYGEWHIDHIIPISLFEFSSADDLDFKMCRSLNNLQPLWAKDNLRKHNK